MATVQGTSGADTLSGGAENDTIDGSDGADVIFGRGGSDQITGGAGADVFGFDGDPFDGADVSAPGRQFGGNEDFIGDFGFNEDAYLFDAADFAMSRALSFQSLDGSAPDAAIRSGANVIVLTNADDDANAATPFNAGAAGNQIANLVSTDGAGFFVYSNSVLNLNRLVYSPNLNDPTSDLKIVSRHTDLTGEAAVTGLQGFTAANFRLQGETLNGVAGSDTLDGFGGADVIAGRGGADVIAGRGGSDQVAGGAGADGLLGGRGDDLLSGGGSDDSIEGGAGRDTLIDGFGSDVLVGGRGRDTFVFTSPIVDPGFQDLILDFERKDQIDLSAIDADLTQALVQPFTFIGVADFSGQAGELRLELFQGGNQFIQADRDGDGFSDLTIAVLGEPMTGADLIL